MNFFKKESLSRKIFQADKLKVHLKSAVIRLQLRKNKSRNQIQKFKRELITQLRGGDEENSKISAEQIIKEEMLIECFEELEIFCEECLARLGIIASSKKLPLELKEPICTLIWVAPRIDVKEFGLIREQFALKYTQNLDHEALCNIDNCVNDKIMEGMSATPPSDEVLFSCIAKIAEENGIEWKIIQNPSIDIDEDDFGEDNDLKEAIDSSSDTETHLISQLSSMPKVNSTPDRNTNSNTNNTSKSSSSSSSSSSSKTSPQTIDEFETLFAQIPNNTPLPNNVSFIEPFSVNTNPINAMNTNQISTNKSANEFEDIFPCAPLFPTLPSQQNSPINPPNNSSINPFNNQFQNQFNNTKQINNSSMINERKPADDLEAEYAQLFGALPPSSSPSLISPTPSNQLNHPPPFPTLAPANPLNHPPPFPTLPQNQMQNINQNQINFNNNNHPVNNFNNNINNNVNNFNSAKDNNQNINLNKETSTEYYDIFADNVQDDQSLIPENAAKISGLIEIKSPVQTSSPSSSISSFPSLPSFPSTLQLPPQNSQLNSQPSPPSQFNSEIQFPSPPSSSSPFPSTIQLPNQSLAPSFPSTIQLPSQLNSQSTHLSQLNSQPSPPSQFNSEIQFPSPPSSSSQFPSAIQLPSSLPSANSFDEFDFPSTPSFTSPPSNSQINAQFNSIPSENSFDEFDFPSTPSFPSQFPSIQLPNPVNNIDNDFSEVSNNNNENSNDNRNDPDWESKFLLPFEKVSSPPIELSIPDPTPAIDDLESRFAALKGFF